MALPRSLKIILRGSNELPFAPSHIISGREAMSNLALTFFLDEFDPRFQENWFR